MFEKLKPCPYCGSSNVTVVCDNGCTFAILCIECGMRGPSRDDKYNDLSHQEAAETWNALPRKLRFSREKPSQNGEWYWYRDIEGELAIGYFQDGCLSFLGGEYVYIDNAPGEYAGPIKTPKD